VTVDLDRPDVAAVHPQAGPRHGWRTTVTWPPRTDSLEVVMVDLYESRPLQSYQVWW
jgi:hypothetical protein